MKIIKALLATVAIVLLAPLVALPQVLALTLLLLAGASLFISPATWMRESRVGMLTLILALLTRKFIASFKSKVPGLNFISTDLGKESGDFAEPVKFGQEVISHLMIAPTVLDHTPGEDLETSAQAITDLATDLYIKIDRAKKVLLKIPTSTSVSSILDGLLDAAVAEAAPALGRAILTDVFTSVVTPANFTHSITETVAGADFDTLRAARIQLNAQRAGDMRFGLSGSQFISNIGDDPKVDSADYHAQRIAGEPYQRLVNIEGFNELREWPEFSADNGTLGTFTVVAATNVITVSAAHGLNIGDRVRVSSATTLPAGLAADTNYFVISVPSTTTLTLSATSGGAVVDITDTGTGVHTMVSYGQLNAFLFDRRAIHFVARQLRDNLELAARLGIPQVVAQHTEVDPDTGLAITAFAWMKAATQDIYIAFTVAYGCKGGRGLAAASGTDPGSIAADGGMDRCGLRVIES